MEKIAITTEYIRLDAFLKLAAGMTGGQAKEAATSGKAAVDGEVCLQRGRKLRPGARVSCGGKEYEVVSDVR